MQPSYWHERWRVGQTGFHQSIIEPNLERFWPSLALASGAHVLVPMCGKSNDLLWLMARGHHVVGVEYSDIPVESFFLENGIPARRRTIKDFDEIAYGAVRILNGDFFALSQHTTGVFDAVFDRAAMVALPRDLRTRYAERLNHLCRPGTRTLLLALEYPQDQAAGPPFCVPYTEIQSLYGAGFGIEQLSHEDILAHEPRMRAKGVTEMSQVCYRLTRRN